MIEQLITLIYQKLERFNDPVSNKPLNKNNNNVKVVCKDGHAHIALIINPKEENR